jgi:hypothetical protein
MKKLLLAFALLLAPLCYAQQPQTNQGFITSTQCVSVPSSGLSYGSYGVTGTWTGTLTAYGAVGQGATVSLGSQTANGSFVLGIGGYTLFEVCGNSVASGAAFVQVYASINGGSGSAGTSANVAVTGPVDGSGYVEVNCKTGCPGANANGQATMANSAPVVLASNQSAVANNITQVAGSALSKTNPVQTQASDGTNQVTASISPYGTAPTGTEVESVNAFVTNTPSVKEQDGSGNALTSNSSTQGRSLDFNLVSVLGATHSKTNPLFGNISDGTNSLTADISAYGTAPTGTEALGVNAFITNTVPVSYGSGTFTVSPTAITTSGIAIANASESSLTAAVVVKASAGNLFGFQITNGSASVCYVEFINASSAPSLGTNAVFSFAVPASGTLTLPPGTFALNQFSTGISVGMATAYNGSSACGTAATGVIFYK